MDFDAHYGNGTAEIFYHDPQVLYISIHQDPHTIFPGKGFVEETGAGEGEGFNLNIPVPPGPGPLIIFTSWKGSWSLFAGSSRQTFTSWTLVLTDTWKIPFPDSSWMMIFIPG